MQVKEYLIDELIPYENNPRNNSDAVDYVANSIKEFGFKVPVVIDKDRVVVAGHTRILAAKKLKMDYVLSTVSPENIPSIKTCEKLGGEYVETVDVPQWHSLYQNNERVKLIYRYDLKEF